MVGSGQLGQERAAQKHEEEQFGPKDSARQIGADAGAGAWHWWAQPPAPTVACLLAPVEATS